MPEWLFVRLLRFYPREFQRDYGADALQLIRDRARDERSVGMQLRLCLDIITDLCDVERVAQSLVDAQLRAAPDGPSPTASSAVQ